MKGLFGKVVRRLQYERAADDARKEALSDLAEYANKVEFGGVFRNDLSLRDLIQGSKLFCFDPLIGHRWGENIGLLFFRYNARKIERYLLMTDEDGFVPSTLPFSRTLERVTEARAKGKKVILLMGGSTVAGNSGYLPKSEIAFKLQEKIGSGTDDAIVVNGGVGGYATDNQVRALMYLHLPRFKPDVVVFYDGWNDSTYLNGYRSTYGSGLRPGFVKQQYRLETINTQMTRASSLVGLAGRISLTKVLEAIDPLNLLQRLKPTLPINVLASGITDLSFHPESVNDYVRNLSYTDAICRREGIRFVHVLQPLIGIGSKADLSEEEKLIFAAQSTANRDVARGFYDGVKEQMKSEAIRNIGLEHYDLRDAFRGVSSGVYKDEGHVYENGNDILAEEIYKRLY